MKKKALTLTLVTILGVTAFYFIRTSATSVEKTQPEPNPVQSESKRSENSGSAKVSQQNTSPVASPRNDPALGQYSDTARPNNYDQSKRAQFIEQIQPILQERLLNEGFTQHEADQTSKELALEFNKNEEVIKYSEAAYRAAKLLNLSEERKNQLNIAVLKSIALAVDIPYDRWNQCMNYRVASMPSCVQEIAQELSKSVAAVISGPSLLGDERNVVFELSKKAMFEAVNSCGISKDEADRALRIVLSDCPF